MAACGGAPEIDEAALALCAKPEHPFAMGTGNDRFNSVQKGQEIWFEPGIQGGFHLWGAVRAGDIDPVDTVIEFELHQDGRHLGGRILPKTLNCGAQGYEYVGVPVELFFHVPAYNVADRPMEMRVILTERNGRTHTDSIPFMPKCCTEL